MIDFVVVVHLFSFQCSVNSSDGNRSIIAKCPIKVAPGSLQRSPKTFNAFPKLLVIRAKTTVPKLQFLYLLRLSPMLRACGRINSQAKWVNQLSTTN